MSGSAVAGSFVCPPTHSAIATAGHQVSAALQAATSGFKLTTSGLDATNRLKTQFTDNNGGSWTDDVTYNADQAAVSIAVATLGRQYRLVLVQIQPGKVIGYKLERVG